MANKQVDDTISLAVLVDKEKKKVIFAESDGDLVDILFSFFTIPVGTIIRLSSDKPALALGCMNNLYNSVEKIDDKHFHSTAFKQMLISPRNNAESHCSKLKLKIDDQTTMYFCCRSSGSICSELLSHYKGSLCRCGECIDYRLYMRNTMSKTSSFSAKDGGVFVKGMSRFIISDDLQVMPMSTAASLSLLSKLGITDLSGIEKVVFSIGVDEVLNLLVCSLLSKTPLTETLLKHKPANELNAGNFDRAKTVEYQMEDQKDFLDRKVTIKLMMSKSKKKVCYAEAKKDFVNLLFSFLTIPVGHFVKQKCSSSSNGCIDHLYRSVQDLDEQCLKSNYHKELLVSPKLASGIGYENDLLGIEEAPHPPYYLEYRGSNLYFTGDRHVIASDNDTVRTEVKVVDPKYHNEDGGGFITGQAIFTVTDDLIIRPISPILDLSILNDLKIPFNDIEEQTVLVGKEEALSLLQTCFVSDSALTNTFIGDPKQCTNEETKDNMYQKIEKKEDAPPQQKPLWAAEFFIAKILIFIAKQFCFK